MKRSFAVVTPSRGLDLGPVRAWTAALVERVAEVKYVRLVGSRALDYWRDSSDWDVVIILDPDLYADPSPGPPSLGQKSPQSWADFELWIRLGCFGELPDSPACSSSVPARYGLARHLEYWFLRPVGGRFLLGWETDPEWLQTINYGNARPGPAFAAEAARFTAQWLQPNSPGVELYCAPDFADPFSLRDPSAAG
jgi:hypothetical protein